VPRSPKEPRGIFRIDTAIDSCFSGRNLLRRLLVQQFVCPAHLSGRAFRAPIASPGVVSRRCRDDFSPPFFGRAVYFGRVERDRPAFRRWITPGYDPGRGDSVALFAAVGGFFRRFAQLLFFRRTQASAVQFRSDRKHLRQQLLLAAEHPRQSKNAVPDFLIRHPLPNRVIPQQQ